MGLDFGLDGLGDLLPRGRKKAILDFAVQLAGGGLFLIRLLLEDMDNVHQSVLVLLLVLLACCFSPLW